ncbi:CoA transferase [Allopusillimonas soli]|uniref:CoA transferase n=1 Tax=Allopusillimonas soli TaxID=659016 RepID=A0A853F9W4_9BURK|nr:CoA transferase [Allopusillimonas soli]NYT36402.1 CoA transferase [Allopusillimonas soli]TEA74914.1 CoA transferase [Allopusillimonas soli]
MKRLLEGVLVADFTWIGAGSYTTKLLADLGADVVKIETSKRLDTLRLAKPYKDGIPGINRSGYFADRNSSKRSITINIKEEQGLILAKRLIGNAHIVTNNFTPGIMDKLGLGYDVVRTIRPGIIYVSMSMQGATGPDRNDLGYGLTIGAVTGLQHLTGLPNKEPAGTGTNFPDHIPNPTHAAFAILAALRHQRRTGVGQSIDIAQTEPTIAMIGPAVMDYEVNGVIQNRRGNRHPKFAPQGVFPCKGRDRWIAITVQSDKQWASLCEVLGLIVPAEWAGGAGRLRYQGEIEQVLSVASSKWDSLELAVALQNMGVTAGPVQDARDVLEKDAQLQDRKHWISLDHPEMGPSTYNCAPFRFSNAASAPSSPAPMLGQHTQEIGRELLGLSETEITALIEKNILV